MQGDEEVSSRSRRPTPVRAWGYATRRRGGAGVIASATSRAAGTDVVSVLVSFTPVRRRPPTIARSRSRRSWTEVTCGELGSADLLSGLRVKPLAGSNPAASATLTRAFAFLEIITRQSPDDLRRASGLSSSPRTGGMWRIDAKRVALGTSRFVAHVAQLPQRWECPARASSSTLTA